MKKTFWLVFLFFFSSCDVFQTGYGSITEKNYSQDRPNIDIVFCVDLSGSTNALVQAFRQQIWDIIGTFNNYHPRPNVRFALIGTGRIEYRKETNYVRILCPFTSDVDRFAYEFFGMAAVVKLGKPNNVQNALSDAIHKLNWSGDQNALKLIYIIGNGRIGEGPYTAYNVVEEAKNEGIITNSVFCVNEKNMAELPQWKLLSDMGRGHFATFNARKSAVLYTPSTDLEAMRRLNRSLNTTYINYTAEGELNRARMLQLDSLSYEIHPYVLQSRLILKSSDIYQKKCQEWDLVDFYMVNQNHPLGATNYINRTIRKKMPDMLRNMGKAQFQEFLEKKERERTDYVIQMQKYVPRLEAHIEKERKKLRLNEGNTLKDILVSSLNNHLEEIALEKVK
jgi:hypothetical protein